MTKLQWFLWGGCAFILAIHSGLMMFAVFIVGEIKERLDKLDKRGQLAAWEAMIIIILIGYGGYMTYLWASKTTETKVFQKGSNARLIDPEAHFGCTNVKVDEFYERKLDAIGNKTSR